MVGRGRRDHGPREPVVNAEQHLPGISFAVVMTGGETRPQATAGPF
jgi:hypothetical protein